MTITTAPTTPAPVTCRVCGRAVRAPLSRVLRVGSHCRDGLTEREILAAMTGAAA